MSVRAKFYCSKIVQSATSYPNSVAPAKHESTEVVMTAVSDQTNKSWTKWTPSGELRLSITNPDALKQFTAGEHYFLDFTPAPAKEADEK